MNIFGKSSIIIFMAIAGAMAAYHYIKGKQWHDFKALNAGLIFVILTAMSFLISCYLGTNISVATEKWVILLSIVLLGYCIAKILIVQNFDVLYFYKIASYLLIFCAVVAVSSIIITHFFPQLDMRPSNLYGSILAMGFPFVAYTAINAPTKKALWCLSLAMLCAGVFSLGGRTGYIVIAACAFVMMVVYPWGNVREALKHILSIGVSMVSGIISGLYVYYLSVGTQIYSSRVGAIDIDRPASGRLYIWEKTFDRFYDHPYFGVGLKGFRDLYLTSDDGHQVLHAHNIVLELLVDTGAIGFILFSMTILWFVMRYCVAYIDLKDKHIRARYLPILIGFIGYGTACMALTSIFHTWWFLYMIIFLVLIGVSTSQMRAAK